MAQMFRHGWGTKVTRYILAQTLKAERIVLVRKQEQIPNI